MLYLFKAIELAQDGNPHDFKFVAKGSEENNRKGGDIVEMKQAVVTSSNNELQKLNLKSTISGEKRWMYYVLLLEFDGQEIFL